MDKHSTPSTDQGTTEREREKRQQQPTVVDRRSDIVLRPPGARLSVDEPPLDPYSPEVQHAVKENGDQPRSAEMEIAPGVTVTLGLRAVYLNFGGLVASVPVAHHAAAHSERV